MRLPSSANKRNAHVPSEPHVRGDFTRMKGAFVPTSRQPRMPQSLGSAGKRLWTTTLDEFELEAEPQKIEILTHACRVTDKVAELERAQRSEQLTVLGSARQMMIHPLIAEVRFQRGLLAQLLGKLGLPGTDEQIEAKREAVSAVRRDASKTAKFQVWSDDP